MKNFYNAFRLFPLLCFILLSGCEKDPIISNDGVNGFIHDNFRTYYLWNGNVVKPGAGEDPFSYFRRLKDMNDPWSLLTDNYGGLNGSMNNTGLNTGMSLVFGSLDEYTDKLFAVVEFVYKNTPAYRAGIRRGDIIGDINRSPIKESNYGQLYYGTDLSFDICYMEGYNLVAKDRVHISAEEVYLDPIIETKVITAVGSPKKTGYIFFSDYVDACHEALIRAFADFKAQGATEIVLDLRSNPGGAVATVELLCSILAPSQVIANRSLMIKELWNDDYMALLEEAGRLDSNTKIYFDPNVAVNMDLDKIYILTSERSASASEMTIIALQPYMDVKIVGRPTTGKYCGGMIFPNKNRGYANWGMYLITFSYANSVGFTGFRNGLYPTTGFEARENRLNMYPLGDESDPLLHAALKDIYPGEFTLAPASGEVNEIKFITRDKMNQRPTNPGILFCDEVPF